MDWIFFVHQCEIGWKWTRGAVKNDAPHSRSRPTLPCLDYKAEINSTIAVSLIADCYLNEKPKRSVVMAADLDSWLSRFFVCFSWTELQWSNESPKCRSFRMEKREEDSHSPNGKLGNHFFFAKWWTSQKKGSNEVTVLLIKNWIAMVQRISKMSFLSHGKARRRLALTQWKTR